eukprot:SAG22_NODE_124_length_18884_cov_34.149367_12_plen_174_part_00
MAEDAIAHEDAHGVATWNYYKTNGLRYGQVMHINNEEYTPLLALKDVTRARFMDSPSTTLGCRLRCTGRSHVILRPCASGLTHATAASRPRPGSRTEPTDAPAAAWVVRLRTAAVAAGWPPPARTFGPTRPRYGAQAFLQVCCTTQSVPIVCTSPRIQTWLLRSCRPRACSTG